MSKYSVVIPCYKSSETIEKVVKLTDEELNRLGKTDHEFILVNDCSPDNGKTVSALREIVDKYKNVTAIDLSKNAGQHNAVLAALSYTKGDFIIAMDDDMQTHPSQLQYLLAEIEKGYDVVYGYYEDKKHGKFRNVGSLINHYSARILIGKPKDMRSSSFWVMRKFVRDSIITYKNSYAYLQGLILRTTRNISCIPIKHFKREVGQSGYTFKKLIKLWSSIIGFSIVPLRLCTYFGYFFSAVGLISSVAIVIRKFVHPSTAMGWPSTMAVMTLFFGLLFLFVGLIGEYIGRMFLSMNNEPQYIIREVIKDEKDGE